MIPMISKMAGNKAVMRDITMVTCKENTINSRGFHVGDAVKCF